MNPHDERELLASDGVHHRLEDARKARRAHADKPLGERVELIVVLGEPIETREVSPESEHAVKDDAGFGNRSPVNSATVRAQLGGETRLPKWPDLTERHFDGSTSQNKHAPVVLAIKVVDSIVRASTKHPGREVEAERGRRVQLEPLQHTVMPVVTACSFSLQPIESTHRSRRGIAHSSCAYIPSERWAASDIRLRSHGGFQIDSPSTSLTPGTASTLARASSLNMSPVPQTGAVIDIGLGDCHSVFPLARLESTGAGWPIGLYFQYMADKSRA